MRADPLYPGPVGWSAAGLPASAPQDEEPAIPSKRCELVGEPALSDPRFPGQQEEASSSVRGGIEAIDELGKLALSPNEDGAVTRRFYPCRHVLPFHRGFLLRSRRACTLAISTTSQHAFTGALQAGATIPTCPSTRNKASSCAR